jgi:molecular chaperone DnaK
MVFDDLLDSELPPTGDREVAVGIDLGTTNSVVAYMRGEDVVVVRDAKGNRLHPSVVAWMPNGKRLVGHEARGRAVIDPMNTIYSVKRIIGQSFRSPRVQEALSHVPYHVLEGESQECLIETRAGRLPVSQVSAQVLGYLKALAEQDLGEPVRHCVVTVPANFTEAQRAATRQAAELAGLVVLRMLNEPTAAAVAYGRIRGTHERIAIFDFGGGTFDCTILAVHGDVFEVLATGGDPFLGGDDLDRQLVDRLVEELLFQHRIDAADDGPTRARLQIAAESIKHRLASEALVEGSVEDVGFGPGGAAVALRYRVTRAELDAIVAPLADRALAVTDGVLSDAGLAAGQIDEVILVGGSTRLALVQARVTARFGRTPRIDLDPMEVVAMGAAIQAQALASPATARSVLLDVTSHSLRVATTAGYTRMLVARNTAIPAEGIATFTTARDDQASVKVLVCQGEDERFEANVPLGELTLDGLPPARRGDVKLQVTFTIDADGLLQVTARDLASGVEARAALTTVGLSASAPPSAPTSAAPGKPKRP